MADISMYKYDSVLEWDARATYSRELQGVVAPPHARTGRAAMMVEWSASTGNCLTRCLRACARFFLIW